MIQLKIVSCAEFWIFPYFMESQIVSNLPSLAMLDYKVEYTNHSQFQNGACSWLNKR